MKQVKASEDVVKVAPLRIKISASEPVSLSDEGGMLTPSCLVTPEVNPDLIALMEKYGAKRESERTWSVPVGASASLRKLEIIFRALDPSICWPTALLEDNKTRPQHVSSYNRRRGLRDVFETSKTGFKAWNNTNGPVSKMRYSYYHSSDEAKTNQMVLLSSSETRLWIKFATVPEYGSRRDQSLTFFDGAPDFNLWKATQRREAINTNAMTACGMAVAAESRGWQISDPDNIIRKARVIVNHGAVVAAIPGSPGLGRLFAGERVAPTLPNIVPDDYHPENNVSEIKMLVAPVEEILNYWRSFKARYKDIDPLVSDVLEMTAAEPTGRDGARHYQDEMISLHLATKVGLINACAPGLGKTFTTLKAWQEEAVDKPNLSCLVICPASIRGQWADETARFFPEATVRVFEARELKDETKLGDWRSDNEDKPTVAILSYASARSRQDTLTAFDYDEIACDEAAVLRSVSSKQAKALHRIRQQAGRAVALTGTPIEGSLDDLGRILSWARNDKELFSGKRLSQRFYVASKSDVAELWKALGPTVFRRDRSEIASELPQIDTQVLAFDPTPEELALDQGARKNLQDILEARRQAVELAAANNPDDPELEKARQEMQNSVGALLSGVTVARMAAADPVAVAHSKSMVRDLLDQSGLIEPAVKKGGTKRIAISDLACDLAENGEGVLIFTDFATIAENLVSEIESNGISVSGYTGKMNGKERDKARRNFQGTPCAEHSKIADFADENCPNCIQPTIDCLVLTEAGEEGLNLQRATTVIHFDLPWTASPVIQRVGRAGRIGSRTDRPIRNVIATMRGTIEERVAALLVPRAAVSLAALDTARGVDAASTEMGLSLSGVEATISEEEKQKAGNQSLFDLAREVLG